MAAEATPEDYVNRGLLVLREGTPDLERTLVVLGVPRGGTSMVAGALHQLGVFMGDHLTKFTFEDRSLARAFEAEDRAQVRDIVRQRDAEHEVWGWKRPTSFKYLDVVERELRNPHYLFVLRDVFAIANRKSISVGTDVVQGMRATLGAYRTIIDFVDQSRQPAMLISYDKAVARPQHMLDEIVQFAGLPVDRMKEAAAFVRPDPQDYIDVSRTR